MTLGEFKAYVATFINRSVDSFVRTTPTAVNVLNQAINDARRSAQRKHSFNRLTTRGYITASATGSALSTIRRTPDGVDYFTVKKIMACWQFDETTLERTRQIDMIRSTDLKNIIPMVNDVETEPTIRPVTLKTRAYVYGTSFYVTGGLNSVVSVDVIEQLGDLTSDAATDFFIDECADWLLFRTLMQLNAYLKETERIQVSKALLDSAWDEIVQNDEEKAGVNDSSNSLE